MWDSLFYLFGILVFYHAIFGCSPYTVGALLLISSFCCCNKNLFFYVRSFFLKKKMEFDALVNKYKDTDTTKNPIWIWFEKKEPRNCPLQNMHNQYPNEKLFNINSYNSFKTFKNMVSFLTTTRPKIAAQIKAAVMMSHSDCINVYPCLTIHNSSMKHFIHFFF